MKKFILIAIAVFALLIPVKAKHVYFNEDFSKGWDTPNLSQTDSKLSNIFYWNEATNVRALFGYYPGGGLTAKPDIAQPYARLASSWQKLEGRQENWVSFSFEYQSNVMPSNNIMVGVQARVHPDSAWVIVSEKMIRNFSSNNGVYLDNMIAMIPTELVAGQDSVQVGIYFRYTTIATDLFLFFADDLAITSFDDVAGKPDAELSVISPGAIVENISTASMNVDMSNESGVAINKVTFGCSVDGGDAKTFSRTASIPVLGKSAIPIPTSNFGFIAGKNNNIKIWISALNDTNLTQLDTVRFDVFIPDTVDYINPITYFVEHFSSSSCPPCAGNNAQMNPYYKEQDEAGKLIYMKYQVNWPGPGDPYYVAADAGKRVGYYGVSGVPTMIGNAGVFGSLNALRSNITRFEGTKSYYNIELDSAFIDSTENVYIKYKITTKIPLSVNIHTAVVENTTYNNKSSNGETEFHHVVMKMFPDGAGNTVNMKADSTYTFTYEYDMSQTFMEHISDLRLIVFVQNDITKEIFAVKQRDIDQNSAVVTPKITSVRDEESAEISITCATEGATIYYTLNGANPTTSSSVYTAPFNIAKNTTIKAFAKKEVLPIDSRVATLRETFVVKAPEITSVVVGDSVEITIICATNGSTIRYTTTGTTPTSSSTAYNAPFKIGKKTTIKAIGTKTDWTSSNVVTKIINVETANETQTNTLPVKVHPNPASEYVSVESPENAKIFLYNNAGTQVYTGTIKAGEAKKISLANYPTGVYVLRVISAKGVATEKIIKK